MREFFVYILHCADDSYYIGHTDNIEKRISEHENGVYCCYTKSRRPICVVFVQTFASRDAAFVVERKIKKWAKAKKQALIRSDWNEIAQLAKRKTRSNI